MKRWLLIPLLLLGAACSKPDSSSPSASSTEPKAPEVARSAEAPAMEAASKPAAAMPAIASMAKPKPAARPAPSLPENVLLRVSSGDLPGLIDGFGATAAEVSPGVSGQQLKSMFGGMLQDPELKGLPSGSGMAFVMMKGGSSALFVEAEAAQGPQYAATLKQQGRVADYADGLLIVAMPPGDATAAKGMATGVETFLKGENKPSLSLTVSFPRLLAEFGQKIDDGLKDLSETAAHAAEMQAKMQAAPGQPGMPNPNQMAAMMKIAQLEVSVLRSILGEADLVRLDLGFDPDKIRVEKTATFIPGTPLGDFFAKPFSPAPVELIKQIPAPGTVRFALGAPDADAVQQLIAREVAAIGKVANATADQQAKWAQIGTLGSNFLVSQASSYIDPTSGTLSGQWIIEAKDPNKVVDAFEKMAGAMQSLGLNDMYHAMGLNMTFDFKRDARKYDGVAVHAAKLSMSATSPTLQTMGMLKMMNNIAYELAARDGRLYMGMGEGKLDSLLDATKAGAAPGGTALAAADALPGGAFVIGNIEPAGLLKYIETMSESAVPGMPNMYKGTAAAMAGAPAISFAGWQQGAQSESTVEIPTAILSRMMAVGMAMQQNMMSSFGGPMHGGMGGGPDMAPDDAQGGQDAPDPSAGGPDSAPDDK